MLKGDESLRGVFFFLDLSVSLSTSMAAFSSDSNLIHFLEVLDVDTACFVSKSNVESGCIFPVPTAHLQEESKKKTPFGLNRELEY